LHPRRATRLEDKWREGGARRRRNRKVEVFFKANAVAGGNLSSSSAHLLLANLKSELK
jgi:hypothetical protein